jgi:N-glycosidase YbiA
MIIYFYSKNQSYYEFSNFAPFGIAMDGLWWQTVEHYYQAMKFNDVLYIEKIRTVKTPNEAGKLGRNRNILIKENWDEIKYDIMFDAVLKKFQTHNMLKDLLIDTGAAKLAENSPFDYYWGIGADGSGLNMLGKILMRIREVM